MTLTKSLLGQHIMNRSKGFTLKKMLDLNDYVYFCI